MPLPQFQPTELQDQPTPTPETGHYFEGVHGDVAALHARIEGGFDDYRFEGVPRSFLAGRFEDSVQFVSRSAGVLGLLGALGLIAYALI
ncbi:MAG TPA: hypothetical protein VF503_23435 [Sphingobium sp.]|uniref:hypothetical protein n=1 Tax=Sphingobium sp. TaxID=1912891 RepID=UPI002ED0BF42